MTPRVTFYDVPPDGRWPLVSRLAEAAWRKEGTRMLIHCADEAEARAIDEYLWTYREEAFLPHALANRAEELDDRLARVVIVTGEGRPIDANVLLQVTPASEAFARGFESVIDLVDHRDERLLARSRERFRAWRESGVVPAFKPA